MSTWSNYKKNKQKVFMKKVIRYVVLLSAVVSLQGFAAAPGQPAQTNGAAAAKSGRKASDLFPDTVVVKGKGVEIKRSELDEEVIRTKTQLTAAQRQPPLDLDQRVLDGMIGARLVLSKATEADKAKGKEQFEKSLDTYRTENKISDAEFSENLGR